MCVGEETRASTLIVWLNAVAYDTPGAWKLTELVCKKLELLESAHTDRRKLIHELTRTFSAICSRDTSELAYLESANLSTTPGFFFLRSITFKLHIDSSFTFYHLLYDA